MKPALTGTPRQELFISLSVCYGFLFLTTQWHTIKDPLDHWGNFGKMQLSMPCPQRVQSKGSGRGQKSVAF